MISSFSSEACPDNGPPAPNPGGELLRGELLRGELISGELISGELLPGELLPPKLGGWGGAFIRYGAAGSMSNCPESDRRVTETRRKPWDSWGLGGPLYNGSLR